MINNVDLFAGDKSADEIRIEESKRILMDYGYKVVEPLEINNNVKSIIDLKKYFYARLWNKYPDRMQYYIQHYKEEIKIVSDFVKSREENTNRNTAIQECIAIIDTIFDNEEDFKFQKPLISVSILRMGWVINLALSIMNVKKSKEEETLRVKMEKEIEDKYMEDNYELVLKIKAEKLDKILAMMEDNNAEKKIVKG